MKTLIFAEDRPGGTEVECGECTGRYFIPIMVTIPVVLSEKEEVPESQWGWRCPHCAYPAIYPGWANW